MAYTQHIYFLFFLLAFAACLEIQYADGRQLKAMSKRKLSPANVETGLENHAKPAVNFAQSLGNHRDDPQVNGQKRISPPMAPTTPSHEFSSSDASHKDAFQPTAPGNSPGVGHPVTAQKHYMQPNVQDFTSVAGKKDRFQPMTTPGHSPGVGHSFINSESPNA